MTDQIGDLVLPVDKPEGPTSHDVVQSARRALGVRRIGHTGTLDPFASGLLLLCVGRATRISEYLTGLPKAYEAQARLGQTTTTDDREGVIREISEGWRGLTSSRIADVLDGFRGDIEQVPPQFSAKKVEGVPMYRRARKGETLLLEPCSVTVHHIELLGVELPLVGFRVECSSGTYVRALARDIGEALGTGAHLTRLRRTQVGHFHVEDALSPDELRDDSKVRGAALTMLQSLDHLGPVEVGAPEVRAISMGQAICSPVPDGARPVPVCRGGSLIAVAEARGGKLRPKKVLVS